MCGICGLYSFSGPLIQPEPVLKQAVMTLKRRGPEVQAHYAHQHVGLAHSRLSIIDVSEAANQPFVHEQGNHVIVFNGEIYNYRSLRDQLVAEGHSFRTQSDTEVLLKWIMHKGTEGISALQGFFAFALFNKLDGSLLLVRDRFGIKPLLFYSDSDRLVFASEMKALLALGIPRNLDTESMQVYFQLNYIPGPWSIYQGVLKLMPGHYMLVKGKEVKTEPYYQIPDEPLAMYAGLSYDNAIKLLQQKLEEAVVKRLVSDVPLGAFLSGGIDSSVIVALAARHVDNLKTFSIGFRDEPMFDETPYARMVAQMHKTDHTEFSLTTSDLLDCMYEVLDYTDEPFADSSALAVYILSRETRQRVTVALSGDGADEMFAGYNKHMAEWRARNGGISARALRWMHPLLRPLPQSRNTPMGNTIRQLYRFGEGMGMGQAQRYWRWAAFASEEYPLQLLRQTDQFSPDYLRRKQELTKYIGTSKEMNDVLRNDMHLVLTNDMLTKVDMMSMANSLEVRVPFLDHEVVNLVFSMPESFKIDRLQRKKILRDAFRPVLPAQLYTRPKQGFEVPLLKWFRTELRQTILDRWLNEDYIQGQQIFDPKVINNLRKKLFSANPGEIHAQIWSIAVFQHWYEKYHNQKVS